MQRRGRLLVERRDGALDVVDGDAKERPRPVHPQLARRCARADVRPVWKSNFGRPTPSTRGSFLRLLDGVEILRHRRDVVPLDGVEVHEVSEITG